MWKEGSIRVNGEVFHYWMKQYDKGSEWGIDGGRISKLMLKRDGKIVCSSERGCCSLYGRSHRFRWRLFLYLGGGLYEKTENI